MPRFPNWNTGRLRTFSSSGQIPLNRYGLVGDIVYRNVDGVVSAVSSGESVTGNVSDWTATPAGGLGSDWWGASWSVGATGAVCSPTLGAELISAVDSREFTGGIGAWVAEGTNAVTAEDGRLKIVYGSSANGAKLTLTAAGGLTGNLTDKAIYRLTFDLEKTAGTTTYGVFINNSTSHSRLNPALGTTALTGRRMDFHKVASGPVLYMGYGMVAGTTVYADNVSLKAVDRSTCLAIHQTAAPSAGSVSCKVVVNSLNGQGGMVGIVARANAATSPTSYLYYYANNDLVSPRIVLWKCLAGVHSQVSTLAVVGDILEHSQLEIQCGAGGLVRIFYNGLLYETLTVSDAELGNYFGMFSTGADVAVRSWWMGATPSKVEIANFGGSVTKGSTGGVYRFYINRGVRNANPDRCVTDLTGAENGMMHMNHIERYINGWMGWTRRPTLVTFDFTANHAGDDSVSGPILEGFVRRVRKDWPLATIVAPIFPYWNADGTLYNATGIAWVVPMLEHYGIICPRVDVALLAEVAADGVGILSTYYDNFPADGVHPGQAGHQRYAEIIEPYLARAVIDGGGSPYSGTITDYARLYAGSDYWEDLSTLPTTKTGWTETGAWADSSVIPAGYYPSLTTTLGSRISTTAGSTIAATITGRWPYIRTANNVTGTLRWRVDGGTWTNVAVYPASPYQQTWFWGTSPMFESAGSHLLEIEVVSGSVNVAYIGML